MSQQGQEQEVKNFPDLRVWNADELTRLLGLALSGCEQEAVLAAVALDGRLVHRVFHVRELLVGDSRVRRGTTLLLEACKGGNLELVIALLDAGSTQCPCVGGMCALDWAARFNQIKVARELLRREVEPHSQTSALEYAALFDHHELCLLLLFNGADLMAKGCLSGRTALDAYGNGCDGRPPNPFPLRNKVKEERRAALKAAFETGPHASQVQRRRESVFKSFLLDCSSRSNQAETRAALVALVDSNPDFAELAWTGSYFIVGGVKIVKGTTALMAVCRGCGDVYTAEMLLRRGAIVNAANVYGISALQLACEKSHAHLCRLLVLWGADVLSQSSDRIGGYSVHRVYGTHMLDAIGSAQNELSAMLFSPAFRGNAAAVLAVIESHPRLLHQRWTGSDVFMSPLAPGPAPAADLTWILTRGANVLEAAAAGGNAELVAALIARGASLHRQFDPNPYRPDDLHDLAIAGKRHMTVGQRVNGTLGDEQEEPLLGSMIEGVFVPKDVAEKAVDFEGDDGEGEGEGEGERFRSDVVRAAIEMGHASVLEMLVVHGAWVNVTYSDGQRPITLAAAQAHNIALVKVLIAANADVNASNVDGITALMMASRVGDGKLVSLLLDAGADPLALNPSLRLDSLGLALSQGHVDVGVILLRRGANFEDAGLSAFSLTRGAMDVLYIRWLDFDMAKRERERRAIGEVLLAAFELGPIMLQRRRQERWLRRWPVMNVMAGCAFRPLVVRLLEQIGMRNGLSPPAPIALDTPEKRRAYSMGLIFACDGLLRLIVLFL